MFGQLVVFSDDQFRRNIFTGVVRESDRKQMDLTTKKFGLIQVYIEIIKSENEDQDLNAHELYLHLQGKNISVVECKSYFEAYSHVLKCI